MKVRPAADDAVSPVVGIILLVAIAVVLAATVVFMVALLTPDGGTEAPPGTAFRQDSTGPGATLEVVTTGGQHLDWSQVSTGSATTAVCTLPTGTITAGDTVVCTTEGTLVLVYDGDNGSVVIYDGTIR